MTRFRLGLSGASALLSILLASLVLFTGTPAAAAMIQQLDDHSRVVTITHQLEQAPLDSSLYGERAWAINWLMETEDYVITICPDPLPDLIGSGYLYEGEIFAQYILSMAAVMIEQPTTVSDPVAQQLAGIEGALAAYRSILSAEPNERLAILDELLANQSNGELPAFASAAYAKCLEYEG